MTSVIITTVLSLLAVWLELFFVFPVWPAGRAYFSLALIGFLVVKQKTRPAFAAAIATGLASDVLAVDAPFGLFVAVHSLFFVAAKKSLIMFRPSRSAAVMLIIALIFIFGLLGAGVAFLLNRLLDNPIAPNYVSQELMSLALSALLFAAAERLTELFSRLARRYFLLQ